VIQAALTDNDPLALGHRSQAFRACFLAAALASVAVATGCGGGGGSGGRAVTRLSGLVAAMDTGSPIPDASVTVDGFSQATRSTARGAFFLDEVDLSRGWHTLRAVKEINSQSWSGERAVLFERDLPVQSNLLITVSPATRHGAIAGHVTTASGVGLGNVTVFLNPQTAVAAAFRVTDSAGRYEFLDVPEGSYTVVASARDLANSGRSPVQVTAGARTTVDLSMLASSGASVGAPASLRAESLTYPEAAAAIQSRLQAVARWLRPVRARLPAARASRRFRIQDWPAGSIIEVDLTWAAPSATNLAGYVLERAEGAGDFGTIDAFADPTATGYFDLDPIYTPDQTYRFRLSAANTSEAEGPPSDIASAQPLGPLSGLTPASGAAVSGPPTFSWQAVPRALRYQVLVLSRLPDAAEPTRMPLVWPPAGSLGVGQTSSTQLTYGGPALQVGTTYYWLVLAYDQPDATTAPSVSTSPIRSFVAR
jgi:hypothetical protein